MIRAKHSSILLCLAALAAAGLVLLSGCRPEQEESGLPLLAEDLVWSQELIDETGRKLAVYSVQLPQLAEQEDVAAGDINLFYQSELEVLKQDCQDWFTIVNGKNYRYTRSNSFVYRLLDAPEGYLAVERTMLVDEQPANYFTEYFSLYSGWQRSFSDLYNVTLKLETGLREAVAEACRNRDIPYDRLDSMSVEQLTANFLPDGQKMRLYFDHQSLSAQQKNGLVVEIPLDRLEEYRKN